MTADRARRNLAELLALADDLLDQLDGPTDQALPVVVGLLDRDLLALHMIATTAIGLLAHARQVLGEDGWHQLRQRRQAATARALDVIDELRP